MKKKLEPKSLYFAVGALVIGAFLPVLTRSNYHMMVLNRMLISIIVILGLDFITGLADQTNLGVAGIFASGAYSSTLFTRYTNLTPWLGLIVAVIMGILIGRELGYPSLRVRGAYLSLTTIGLGEAMRLLISNTSKFAEDTQDIRNIRSHGIGSCQIQSQKGVRYPLLASTATTFFTAWRTVYSRWGRIFKSLWDNMEAVEMSGVGIAPCEIKAFTAISIFGTVAEAMYAYYMDYINPSTFSLDLSINYVVMLIMGGLGSVVGTTFGSTIVTILLEMLRFLGSYY